MSTTRTTRLDRRISTILVVDDDPMVLSLLQLVLKRDGVRVETAEDGKTAIARARQRPPALVVIDLHLPDAAGEAIITELRMRWSVSVPVILMSGDPAGEIVARRTGAVAFLLKPFDPRRLRRAVDELLPASDHG